MADGIPFQEWFDSLDWDAIEQLKHDRAEESIHREFKRFEDRTKFARKDKENLAKAIAGFSNAEGGVFLFGPVTQKIDEIDGVSEIQLIENLSAVTNKIKSLLPEATSPPAKFVDVKSVECPDKPDQGVIAVLIAESDTTPHMAKLKVNQYFRRCSDSTRLMEHSEIADMFGRRPHPNLSLTMWDSKTIDPQSGRNAHLGSACKKHHYIMTLGLKNSGIGTALFPAIEVWLPKGTNPSVLLRPLGHNKFTLPQRPRPLAKDGQRTVYGGSSEYVVLPGETLDVVHLEVFFSEYDDLEIARKHTHRVLAGFAVRCDAAAPKYYLIELDGERMRNIEPGHFCHKIKPAQTPHMILLEACLTPQPQEPAVK